MKEKAFRNFPALDKYSMEEMELQVYHGIMITLWEKQSERISVCITQESNVVISWQSLSMRMHKPHYRYSLRITSHSSENIGKSLKSSDYCKIITSPIGL